jgi:hypothetical protein
MEQLTIHIISGADIWPIKDPSKPCASYCILKFNGREIGKTDISEVGPLPVWQNYIAQSFNLFCSRIRDYNRPVELEHIDIEVWDEQNNNCVGEGRIPLVDIHKDAQFYKIYRQKSKEDRSVIAGKVLVAMQIENSIRLGTTPISYLQLFDVLKPDSNPQYRHLFFDFETSSLSQLAFSFLPGPKLGEIVLDKHDNVEWRIAQGMNAFGDKYFTTCRGSLIITEFRIIYIPHEIRTPPWANGFNVYSDPFIEDYFSSSSHPNKVNESNQLMPECRATSPFSAEEMYSIQKLTFQMALFAIQDLRLGSLSRDNFAQSLIIEGKDQRYST